MKKVLILLLISISATAFAQRAFIRQNGTTNVYYLIDSVFQTAQNGDTIYLPGGSFNIGSLTINKRLTIIGVGHVPDSTQATYSTTLVGNIYLTSAASNGSISGLYLTAAIYFGTNPGDQSISFYSVSRCNVSAVILGYNPGAPGGSSYITIKENIIRSQIIGCNSQFVSIENNLVQGDIYYFNTNMLAKNNTFLGGNGCPAYAVNTVFNCTFENNVFMLASGCGVIALSTVGSCIFTNNVFNNNMTFPSGSNIGSGNNINVSQTNFFVSETNWLIEYTDNFHLQNPGIYLGTDGFQVGIYGSSIPYKEGAVPYNPHIRSKTIAPQTNSNGDLLINIGVGAQQR